MVDREQDVAMKTGKVSETILRRSVLKHIQESGVQPYSAVDFGTDFAAISSKKGEHLVLSTQPVTCSHGRIGSRGVYGALNNVACSGAQPVGVLTSILMPTEGAEHELGRIVEEVVSSCDRVNAVVLGGHTEVTRRIKSPLLTVTGVGRMTEMPLTPDAVRPGMELVATKWIGLEGTAILVEERREELGERFSQPFLDEAERFGEYLPVLKEAAVAVQCGAVAMHDASWGGIFGALWEFGSRSGVGIEVELRSLPIRQETIEVCEFFGLNPYKLLSGGSLLIAAEDGNYLTAKLRQAGIPAAVVGRTTEENGRVVRNGEERRYLETTQTDELHRVMG